MPPPRSSTGGAAFARGWSHQCVFGAVPTLGRRQASALRGDRAALDAVGGSDLDSDDIAGRALFTRDLVDLGRTHAHPRLRELPSHLVVDADVARSIVAGLVSGEIDARELVEEELPVRLRVGAVTVTDEDRDLVVALQAQVPRRQLPEGVHRRPRQHRATEEAIAERRT